jgi:hypothetical protein
LFTAISAALAHWPEVSLSRKPRMADFALWATAAELALGFHTGAFMDAYSGNRVESVQETLESDPVSAAILVLISDETGERQWSGTAGGMLEQLERIGKDGVKKSPAWPKTPRGLSSRLRRLATFLRESGIEITFHHQKSTGGQRLLTVRRAVSHLTAATALTASAEPTSLLNQPAGTDISRGRRVFRVADERYEVDRPPLELRSDIPVNEHWLSQSVAEGAVVCEGVLVGPSQNTAASDRFKYCACRGPIDWQWNGTDWMCPLCEGLSESSSPSPRLTSPQRPSD